MRKGKSDPPNRAERWRTAYRENAGDPKGCKDCGADVRTANRRRGTCDPCEDSKDKSQIQDPEKTWSGAYGFLVTKAEIEGRKKSERKRVEKIRADSVRVSMPTGICPKGHDVRLLGVTRTKRCFTCQKKRNPIRVTEPHFDLAGLRDCAKGVSLAKVAKAAGMDDTLIYKYASGATVASQGAMRRIAQALGVDEKKLKGAA